MKNIGTLLPVEVVNLWGGYGFGTFMQGYFKIVNPEEDNEILQKCSQRFTNTVIVFATGLGDLVLWADGYVRLLHLRNGILQTLMPNFLHFFKSLDSEVFKDEYLKWNPYADAVKQSGKLSYDECFGYVPLLGIGGEERVEHLYKVNLKEHILLITEMMRPVQ